MSDWQEITSPPFTNADGSLFNGWLLARVMVEAQLAGGAVVGPDTSRFTVTNGLALGSGAGGFAMLPITEDANPGGFAIGLALEDAQGRKRRLGEVVVDRPDGAAPYPAIALTSILPVADEI